MSVETADNVDAAYMSSPQVARMLGITGVGVAQLVRQGKIPGVKIANRWLIPRAFVEEFARTYEGRRGRPRKKGPAAGAGETRPETPEPALAGSPEPALVETPEAALAMGPAAAPAIAPPVVAAGPYALAAAVAEPGTAVVDEPAPAEAPAAAGVPAEPAGGEARPLAAPPVADLPVQVRPVPVPAASGDVPGEAPDRAETLTEPEEADTGEAGAGFRVRAEVYHLDRNYDFEVYEKGRITDRARIIVARLKPRIPSLPRFSFRWDYRYEHLNVDIHGVEPPVVEWWTMGQNGYTGHLPRRLSDKGYTFEAVVWLPVTFVFRGRLDLDLGHGGGSREGEGPPSVATTTGGLRRLWSRWPGKPHS